MWPAYGHTVYHINDGGLGLHTDWLSEAALIKDTMKEINLYLCSFPGFEFKSV